MQPLHRTECDEQAFRYLLAVERARAERLNRPVRLLLASLEPDPANPVPIPRDTAARLFDALRVSLRETDVTGWYREHRVAGAVLSERPDTTAERSDAIEKRVADELRQRLPSKVAHSLRVRVVHLGRPFVNAIA